MAKHGSSEGFFVDFQSMIYKYDGDSHNAEEKTLIMMRDIVERIEECGAPCPCPQLKRDLLEVMQISEERLANKKANKKRQSGKRLKEAWASLLAYPWHSEEHHQYLPLYATSDPEVEKKFTMLFAAAARKELMHKEQLADLQRRLIHAEMVQTEQAAEIVRWKEACMAQHGECKVKAMLTVEKKKVKRQQATSGDEVKTKAPKHEQPEQPITMVQPSREPVTAEPALTEPTLVEAGPNTIEHGTTELEPATMKVYLKHIAPEHMISDSATITESAMPAIVSSIGHMPLALGDGSASPAPEIDGMLDEEDVYQLMQDYPVKG